ncbi:MAG: hypothetical protein C7B46_19880 [Sulfobacillus benefaciens]|uniref:Uncharacterized protein n=1 Tax=Sulfobacillus benefaciens TaxID=453960 RepID=A0A2T2WWJ5_9FIRM|nr:MAG: hypothetical protein C7B46_19880 [Sulfobacillus benefaciens]
MSKTPVIANSNDISEREWNLLQEYFVVRRPDESILAISGIWSTGQRSYAYSTLEIAGVPAYQSGIAKKIAIAKGSEVEEYRADCNSKYDGTGYHNSGKISRIEVYLVPPNVPIRLKRGSTYFSARGIPHGNSHVHFFGGPESPAAYRAQSAKLQQAQQNGLDR